METEQQLICI